MLDASIDGWLVGCVRSLLSHRPLATYFLDEVTLVLGGEDELPTSAPESDAAYARELLDGIVIHAGREHVEHVLVDVAIPDDQLVPLAVDEPVPVPLPIGGRNGRWWMIAQLARGVVAPIVLPFADEAAGRGHARGMVLDVATLLAGFGPAVLRAADVGSILWRGEPRHGEWRQRDLDAVEAAHVQAVFEALHDLDPEQTDRALGATARSRMREARTWAATRRDDLARLRVEASGALASYRDRGTRVR